MHLREEVGYRVFRDKMRQQKWENPRKEPQPWIIGADMSIGLILALAGWGFSLRVGAYYVGAMVAAPLAALFSPVTVVVQALAALALALRYNVHHESPGYILVHAAIWFLPLLYRPRWQGPRQWWARQVAALARRIHFWSAAMFM